MPLSGKKYLLTGSSGFVGTSVLNFFGKQKFILWRRGEDIKIQDADVVLHFAGKSHDFKNIFTRDEYYQVNFELTKKIFDAFLVSDAVVFITLSSVKAVADELEGSLTEEYVPNPITHYGKSKLLSEKYILSKEVPEGKRVYILRPCLIHGPGNKGNLNLLYKIFSKSIPWPLGRFDNKRSFCSIDNLIFIINEFINREDIPSGVFNIADDESLSTNDVISILAESQNRKVKIWNLSKVLIKSLAKLGDLLRLPFTTERLQKLTESYVVSNQKLKTAIGKSLPVSAKAGLLKTFNSFHKSAQ
jgi:nucleoside-diphosphate-sugar epimerase